LNSPSAIIPRELGPMVAVRLSPKLALALPWPRSCARMDLPIARYTPLAQVSESLIHSLDNARVRVRKRRLKSYHTNDI
jgi:hypothetical protein